MTHGRPHKPFWFLFLFILNFLTLLVALCVSPPRDTFKRFISVERGEGAILDRRQGRGEYCYNALYTHASANTRLLYTYIMPENDFVGQNEALYGTAASGAVCTYNIVGHPRHYIIIYYNRLTRVNCVHFY